MAKHNRSAWGTLSYDPKRRVARIRYWAETPDGYRRCSKTLRDVTRRQAEEARAALMLDHSQDAPCPTVAQAWSRWALPDMRQRVADGDLSQGSLDQYLRWWGKHVEPTWGGVPLDEVRPLAVQQWISSMGYSQATNAIPILRKVMAYAVRYELRESNPLSETYVMPSRSTVRRRDKGVWTLPELEQAWMRVHGTWMEAAFLVAAFGGTRVGEAMAPVAGEVTRREVQGVPVTLVPITRQVEHHGRRVTDKLKTEHSRRTVAIAGKAAVRLAELAGRIDPMWYLTNDGTGNPVSQSRFMDGWNGLGMEHPFRNLRNSWQTWMKWDMHVAPEYVEPMMGHRLRGTTGRYYDRPQGDVFAEVVAAAYTANPYDDGWDVG